MLQSYFLMAALVFMGFMLVFGRYNEFAVRRLIKDVLSGELANSALLEELRLANRRAVFGYRRRLNWLMRHWRVLPETLVPKARRIILVEYLAWASATMMLVSAVVGGLIQDGYI